MKKFALGSLAAVAMAASMTATAMDLEDAIQYRQAGYKFMSWNMGTIKGNLEGEWNLARVQAAANSIAGIANSGMGALYLPGTDQDVGNTKTRVKPEMFTDIEGATEVGIAFNKAANALAQAAASEDKAAIASAFRDAGAACKGCHDKFRKD